MIKQGIIGFGMPTGVVRVIVSVMLLTACCSVSAQSSQQSDGMKPTIESAVILHIVPNAPQYASYDAYYEVRAHDANGILVGITEEYSPQRRTKYFNNQNVIVDVAKGITAPYRAWIDFTAENEYGRCVYTIELLPYGEVGGYYIDGEPVASVSMPEADQVERFVVYTLSGTELCRIDSLSALSDIDYSGVVIIHRYVGSHKIGTSKIRL